MSLEQQFIATQQVLRIEQSLGQTVRVRIDAPASTAVVEVDDTNDDVSQAGSSHGFGSDC